jgi:hypothetical protein
MLKETIDTNSSNENYADRFALPIAEAEEKTETTNQQQIGNIQQAINLNIDAQQASHHLLKQMNSVFFNEMTDDQVLSPETAEKIEDWLSQHSIYQLEKLNETAKAHFLYQGITFAVYGETSGIDRTIPFDLIPRVIAKQQWNKIAAGCTQRIQ